MNLHPISASLSRTNRIIGLAFPALVAACIAGGCSDKSAAQADARKAAPSVPVLTGQVVEKSMPLRPIRPGVSAARLPTEVPAPGD